MRLNKKIIDKAFNKLMKECEPKETCKPNSCYGECQGMGTCEVAVGFRKNLHIILPTIISEKKKKVKR